MDNKQDILWPVMHDFCQAKDAEKDIFYRHSDHLGSANWITDQDGYVVQYLHYLPYGQMLLNQQTAGYDEQYKFTGKERDAESGYDYFGARYYAPPLFYWTTVDPLAEKYYHISPYAWCGNNPIVFVDLDGREILGESNRDKRVYVRYKNKVNTKMHKHARRVKNLTKILQKCGNNNDALLQELHKEEQLLAAYQQIKYELNEMEKSKIVFIIKTAKEWGSITLNTETKEVNINITENEQQAIISISHELCHGFQYLDGRLDFSDDGKRGGDLYDITDEREAIQRQNLFDTSLDGLTEEEINILTEKFLKEGYSELDKYRSDSRPTRSDIGPEVLTHTPDERRR
jgi:RHS repeat-associated protein